MAKTILVALATAAVAGAEPIETWYSEAQATAAGAPAATGPSVVVREWFIATPGCLWAPFQPVALKPGSSATFSCTVDFEHPPAAKADNAFRVALLGAPPERIRNDNMRGYMIATGQDNGRWMTRLWERQAITGFPATIKGCTNRVTYKEDKPGAAETSMRVVMTVRRADERTYEVSGFVGAHAFAFAGLHPDQPFDTVNIAAVLLGPESGTGSATIEKSRVTSP